MRNLLDQIKQDIDNFVKDAEAHVAKGNKAAGTRARKVSLDRYSPAIFSFYVSDIPHHVRGIYFLERVLRSIRL